MKNFYHARKKRQLKFLAKELKHLHTTGNRSAEKTSVLKRRIFQLIRDLRSKIFFPELRKIVAGVAVYFGISFSNESSAQYFALPQFNPFGLTPVTDLPVINMIDFDGDGDYDMMQGGYGSFVFFENQGTSTAPMMDSAGVNLFGLDSTLNYSFSAAVDLDGDGDTDLLVGEYYGNLQYFENTGSATAPSFAPPVMNPFGLTAGLSIAFPSFADLDGDGDMDLMVGEYYGNFQYFENVGTATAPAFTTAVQNPFGLTPVSYFGASAFADVDNDGDQDYMVGELGGSMIYFENTGTSAAPVFSSQVNPFGIQTAYYIGFPAFADMDNDGDVDLFIGEVYGNIKYYEQVDPAGFAEKEMNSTLTIFPNPTTDVITIGYTGKIFSVEVYNQTGQLVLNTSGSNRLDVAGLPAGNYLLRIIDEDGNQQSSMFQKQ